MKNINNVTYEIITKANTEWDTVLENFKDANLYQTYAYNKYSIGGENSEQFVLKIDNKIVAATLVRVKTLSIIERGIAYVRWGTMWRAENENDNLEILKLSLKYLHKEYVAKRKLYLRIAPYIYHTESKKYNEIFLEEDFSLVENKQKYRTFLLDLKPSLDEIKKNFVKDWRRRIRKGFESNLEIVQGTNDELYKTFLQLYDESHSRKNFKEYVNVNDFREIQKSLSENLKMNILICKHENEPIAAFVIAGIGKIGLALLAGSNHKGLKMNGAVMLHWKTIEWLKETGHTHYDFGGIDPDNNPSVYKFKKGSGAKDINFIGEFYSCNNFVSASIVKVGEFFRK